MPGDADALSPETPDAISSLVVEGFKSLAERTEIEIRPLTLLAGANSSGKSSAMQPLLLLKQTLDAQFDPGSLLLDGPNVSFNESNQILSMFSSSRLNSQSFAISIRSELESSWEIVFSRNEAGRIEVESLESTFSEPSRFSDICLRFDLSEEEIRQRLPPEFVDVVENNAEALAPIGEKPPEFRWIVLKERCFLKAAYASDESKDPVKKYPDHYPEVETPTTNLIHVPGLRDNPSRTYRTTAVSSHFPGTFDDYVASVIHAWQREGDERLERLVGQLRHMGLTGGVEADRVNDTQVELRVEQQSVGSGAEGRMINVADVGIGVSQVLPVLVACLVADEGQLVYVEQPEIHLHPRAQTRLADALVAAANRGVRVVVKTHSQLLLLALQTRIAEDDIAPERVMLHWFERRNDGVTEVTPKVPDEKGAFGDWPEDFSEVEMEAENRYLDAAEKHLFEE
jgi:predicted ATPase